MYFMILLLVIFIAPIPIILREMKKGTGAYRTILQGVIGVAVASVFVFILASVSGAPLGETMSASIDEMSQILASNSQFSTLMGLETMAYGERISFLTEIYQAANRALPSTVLVWAAVISYFEYMFFASRLNRTEQKVNPLPPLSSLSLPKNSIIGFVIMIVLAWLFTLTELGFSDALFTNVNMIFEFAFCIQGIGMIFFFFNLKKWPKILAIIATVIFFLTGLGKMLLFMMGLFDLAFDLRKKVSLNQHKK